ncbi:MAG TPA: PspC domain-containing protein [Bacteroidales bacterium]|nr:PspC domain-containing protein [Bacteroidales bacterium]
MDKTININIGGSLFSIDEDAFGMLRDWLQSLNNRFRNVQGGLETIEDIEMRVAEIFHSQKGLAGVITKDNVESMISIIGKPEDFEQQEPEDSGKSMYTRNDYRRRLYRNPQDTIISGVCGGLGAYLNTDPVLFRILFAVAFFVFGSGFLIYIILWIALPVAHTESQMRELFGSNFYAGSHGKTGPGGSQGHGNVSSGIGNAFNEIFGAIGKVIYIIARIMLILMGIVFVITGFTGLMTFILVFVFKFPNILVLEGTGLNMNFLPDFMSYIVSAGTVPWIIGLSSIVIVLPLLALIYWGIKMIIWFRARDGIFSLAAIVVWVASLAILSIVLFNEGTSFANTARTSSEAIVPRSSDTLYIVSDHKLNDVIYNKEVSFPDDEYEIFINDNLRELYIRPYLSVKTSGNNSTRIEVRKHSAAATESIAYQRLRSLQFNYGVKRDTVRLDEYFRLPEGRKWSADFVGVKLYIPEGTVVKLDKNSDFILHSNYHYRFHGRFGNEQWDNDNKIWIMSDDELVPAGI